MGTVVMGLWSGYRCQVMRINNLSTLSTVGQLGQCRRHGLFKFHRVSLFLSLSLSFFLYLFIYLFACKRKPFTVYFPVRLMIHY